MTTKTKATKRATKANRANGNARPSSLPKDKAKNGKLPRRQPREQTFLPEHSGRTNDTRPPIKKVLSALKNYRKAGPDQWVACCPCPDCHDTSEHLHVYRIADGKGQKLNDGDVVLRCYHAGNEGGCTVAEIVEALGLQMGDLFALGPDAAKPPALRKAVTPRREAPLYTTLGKTAPPPSGDLRTADGAERDWAAMVKQHQLSLTKQTLKELATELGVTPQSLSCLHIGLTRLGFTFPEFNGAGEVVGISVRRFDGDKLMLPGSRRGIYIPQGWYGRRDPVLLVEGASDVAAATMLGFAALGRPDCSSGAKMLAEAILTGVDGYDPDGILVERKVVVMGENDAKPDGRWPGKTGAIKVAEELSWHLGRPVSWALPDTAKDLRAWVAALKQAEQHHA